MKNLAGYVMAALHLIRLALKVSFIREVIGLQKDELRFKCVKSRILLQKMPIKERRDRSQDARYQRQESSKRRRRRIFPRSENFRP